MTKYIQKFLAFLLIAFFTFTNAQAINLSLSGNNDSATHKIKDKIADTINILENDGSGVIASTVKLYSNVPNTEGNGTKKLVVPNEGTWTVSNAGILLFVPLSGNIRPGFQPTEITYNAVDNNGYTLDSAIAKIVYDDDWDS